MYPHHLTISITFAVFAFVASQKVVGQMNSNLDTKSLIKLLEEFSKRSYEDNSTQKRGFEYNDAFSTLFVNKSTIEKMKCYRGEDILPTAKIRKFEHFWTNKPTTDMKPCPTKRSTERRNAIGCNTCCETVWTCGAPITVEYQRKEYLVVHPAGGFQLIFKGQCQQLGSRCTFGECQEEMSYFTYILIEDPELDYEPPHRFVPISYPRMCHCVNIGSG